MATQGERIASLETSTDEHERRLNAINGQIEGVRSSLSDFREETGKSLAVLVTKVGMYAAVGGVVGGGLVSFVVYLIVGFLTKQHPAANQAAP